MGTTEQWAKCWLFLSTIRIIYSTGDVAEYINGTKVAFFGLQPGENSTIFEEHNYINLTVQLNDQNIFHLKISYQQNNLSVDLCKFIINPTCEVSDSSNASSHCQCLNNHTAQFFKKASSSDSGLYTWTWRDGGTQEKHRDIFINVIKGNGSDDTASAATTATIVCVLLIIVVAATAGVVLWMRNTAKCRIEVKVCGRYFRWRGSDDVKDNQVNDQNLSNGDNHHSTNYSNDPNYANDNELDAIHDPNYDDRKEQNNSQPLECSYNKFNPEKRSDDSTCAYVKKMDKSQSSDPTTPTVYIEHFSQQLDPYYSDIKEPALNQIHDPNHTNDTRHHATLNYDPNYADINEHEANQPPDPAYSNINQHSSHIYDPNYTEVKVEENSKPDDPNFAHVKMPKMRHRVNKKKMEVESFTAHSPKDKQKPASPHHSTHFQGKQDTTERDGFYNHLHEIHQHDDPNYDHILTSTRQSADLTFQQDKGHNDLSYPNSKRENTI